MQARTMFVVLLITTNVYAADAPFEVASDNSKLVITRLQKPVAEFVFRDEKILRPFFANVHTPAGVKVTRNHPPQAGDATDHDAMHPGIWLAFGDINGHDFWRNKGRIEHVRFSRPVTIVDDNLEFTTESKLVTADNKPLGRLTTQISMTPQSSSWRLVWDATFHADETDLVFGDQEEMGFGARLATPLIEKNGGVITNANGQKTAAKTWGQPAAWCDYSGKTAESAGGIMLVTSPANFRESWWHNRDYGLFVANPFGRAAMKQGDRSAETVRKGETLRLRFAAVIHDGNGFDPAAAAEAALKVLK